MLGHISQPEFFLSASLNFNHQASNSGRQILLVLKATSRLTLQISFSPTTQRRHNLAGTAFRRRVMTAYTDVNRLYVHKDFGYEQNLKNDTPITKHGGTFQKHL